MKKWMGILVFAILAWTAFFPGCTRRDLEIEYRETMRVVVKCVWKIVTYPEVPTGMTLYFFREGDMTPKVITTSNVDSCVVELGVGKYKAFAISQSPEEYWTYQFDNMNNYDLASVTLIENPSTWYAAYSKVGDDELVVNNPENLAVGIADEFEITQEMIDEFQEEFYTYKREPFRGIPVTPDEIDKEEIDREIRTKYYTIEIPVDPKNIVSQLWVTIYAGNIDMLRSVRAATSGMARTFALTGNTTLHPSATQVINQWSLEVKSKADRVGRIDGIITTLGLPDGDIPSVMRDSTLNVSTLLVDNKTTADFYLNVGDKFRLEEPNPGYRNLYRLVFGSETDPAIIIPEVEPAHGGGFTAGVEDWEEEVEVEIPI